MGIGPSGNRMREIWNECVQFCHWKIGGINWQVIVCQVCHAGDELEGLRWSIEFKVSQSVRGLEDDSVKSIVTVSDSWNNAVQSFLFHLNQIQILGKQNNQSKEPESYSSNRRKYRQGRHFLFSPQAALCLTTPLAPEGFRCSWWMLYRLESPFSRSSTNESRGIHQISWQA